MKETKVYVDRGLLSSFYTRSGTDLDKRKWVQAEIVFYNVNNIYLYDIKTHDRELVKEVCEKIRKKVDNISMHTATKERLMLMCEEIEKEFENGDIDK